jgi:hypothetical protein
MTGAAAFPPVSGGTHFSTYTFQCGSYPTCSTVQYRQSNAQAISAQTYGHLEVNPSANAITDTFPAGTVTINGDLRVGGTNTGVAADASVNSTTLSVAGDVTINANSTLKAHASNPFTVTGDWTDNGTFNANGGTVTLNGIGGQTLGGSGSRVFNNLSLSPASAASATLGTDYTVNGTLTLNANATLADGGNILTAKGAIANSGSHTGTGKILLNGSSAQALSGTGTYTNLEINNASGATLSASITVNGTLTLTSGDVVTGANVLKIGSAGTATGAAAAKHVVGNVQKAYAAAGSFTFPVGDGTNYTPVTLNFTSLITPGNVTASTTNSEHPDTTAAADGLDKNKSLNRYWTIKNSSLAGSYTATFFYVAGDRDAGVTVSGANLPNVFIKQGSNCSGAGVARTCAAWTAATLNGTPSTTQAAAAAITITSVPTEVDFALGEPAITNFAREQQFIYTRELY